MNYEIIPKAYKSGSAIPLELEVTVNGVSIYYTKLRTASNEWPGYEFYTFTDIPKEEAEEMVRALIKRILDEHDEEEHGVRWVTKSFEYTGNRVYHTFEWHYRVRDSY